ncbi:tape measure protein [Peribacillus butanolivorans]|uniref:tape measure protein n=1 Tax=Peribacillus butanolivorans TaxID=421767 RepID=UPI0037CA9236
MEKIEGLSIGLDLDSTALNRGLTGVKDKLKAVNSEMKANMSAFDRGDRSIGKYETRLSGLNRKLEVQKEVTKQAKAEYEKMVRENGEGSKKADEAAKSYNNEVAALNNLERYVGGVKEELKKMKEEQRIAFSGWTKAGDSLINFGSGLKSISDKTKDLGKSLTKKLTLPAVGAATALGSIALVKGFNRLIGIDTARAKLTGLGHDAKGVEKIMESALDSVRGTSFGLDEAATTAANAVAAGVEEGKELTRYLSLTGDASAIAGAGLGEMGSILNKVKTSNKAYNGELQQLSDRGLPIYQWLADEAGVAADAVFDMSSKGEISSEMLMNAIEKNIGGAAKKMGETSFIAGIANMWAAVGRIGASFLDAGGKGGGFFSTLKPMIADFTNRIDSMGAFAEKAGVKLGEMFTGFIEKVKSVKATYGSLSPSVQNIIKKVAIAGTAITVGLGPVLTGLGMFGGFIAKISTGLGVLFTTIAKAGGLLKWLRLGFTALTGPVGLTIGILALLAAGIVIAYKKFEPFRNAINKLKDVFISAFKIIVDYFKSKIAEMKAFWDSNGKQLLQAFHNIFNGIMFVIKPMMPIFKAIFKVTFKVILEIVKSVFGNIKGVINGGLKVIMGLIQVFSGLFTGDFSKMWTGIKNIFSGSIQFIWNFMQLMFWGKMLKGILSLGKLMVNAFKGMWGSIKNVFSTVIKWIVDFVKNRFTSMKNTINTITTTIKNLISTIWNGILNFFKLVINSIVDLVKSRFTTLKNTINTIFSGIRNLTKTIWNAIKDSIYTPIKNAVTNTISRFTILKSRISEIFGAIKKNIKGYVSDMVETVKGMPQRMSDGLKKTGGKIKEGVISVSNKMVSGLGKGVNGVITGVNWVMGKVGVKKKNQLDPWEIPQYKYAKGTDGHPGGPAIVGDGGMSELISFPNGRFALSPATDTLVNLPRATSVMSGPDTKLFLDSIPAYKNGEGWLTQLKKGAGDAWDATKKGAKKVKDTGVDIWQYASNPSKLLDLSMKTLGITAPTGTDVLGQIAKGGFTKVKNSAVDFVKGQMQDLFGEGGSAAPAGKGVERWRSVILKAAAMMKESVNPSEVNGILAQIKRESTGNEKIVQSSAVWDVNTAAGNPARGLLQYIPQTFNAYKMKGHNNIYSGYDQLLAFFNNSTWRRDLPYGRRGWGPRGKRKYKNGTGLLGHMGGDAILGDGGKVEPFLMPNGLLGLSPDSTTLFPNLPKGTIVWPSIQDFLKEYTENQAAAFTIPTNETYRTDAMKLLALAGKTVDKGNKSPGQLPNVGTGGSEGNNVLQKLLEATLEQTKVLLQLLNKDTDIILNGSSVAKGIHREVGKYQTQDKRISKRTIKGKVRK